MSTVLKLAVLAGIVFLAPELGVVDALGAPAYDENVAQQQPTSNSHMPLVFKVANDPITQLNANVGELQRARFRKLDELTKEIRDELPKKNRDVQKIHAALKEATALIKDNLSLQLYQQYAAIIKVFTIHVYEIDVAVESLDEIADAIYAKAADPNPDVETKKLLELVAKDQAEVFKKQLASLHAAYSQGRKPVGPRKTPDEMVDHFLERACKHTELAILCDDVSDSLLYHVPERAYDVYKIFFDATQSEGTLTKERLDELEKTLKYREAYCRVLVDDDETLQTFVEELARIPNPDDPAFGTNPADATRFCDDRLNIISATLSGLSKVQSYPMAKSSSSERYSLYSRHFDTLIKATRNVKRRYSAIDETYRRQYFAELEEALVGQSLGRFQQSDSSIAKELEEEKASQDPDQERIALYDLAIFVSKINVALTPPKSWERGVARGSYSVKEMRADHYVDRHTSVESRREKVAKLLDEGIAQYRTNPSFVKFLRALAMKYLRETPVESLDEPLVKKLIDEIESLDETGFDAWYANFCVAFYQERLENASQESRENADKVVDELLDDIAANAEGNADHRVAIKTVALKGQSSSFLAQLGPGDKSGFYGINRPDLADKFSKALNINTFQLVGSDTSAFKRYLAVAIENKDVEYLNSMLDQFFEQVEAVDNLNSKTSIYFYEGDDIVRMLFPVLPEQAKKFVDRAYEVAARSKLPTIVNLPELAEKELYQKLFSLAKTDEESENVVKEYEASLLKNVFPPEFHHIHNMTQEFKRNHPKLVARICDAALDSNVKALELAQKELDAFDKDSNDPEVRRNRTSKDYEVDKRRFTCLQFRLEKLQCENVDAFKAADLAGLEKIADEFAPIMAEVKQLKFDVNDRIHSLAQNYFLENRLGILVRSKDVAAAIAALETSTNTNVPEFVGFLKRIQAFDGN